VSGIGLRIRSLRRQEQREHGEHSALKIAKPWVGALPCSAMSPADYLATLAEPTRLRVLSCLAAAPLYVSDIQRVLGLRQPTVSRHLRVLRQLGLARAERSASRMAYHLTLPAGTRGRMVRAVLTALRGDPAFRLEADSARTRAVSGQTGAAVRAS
jgi:DNA-binding transcriptional ArsR family regulator